MANSGGFYVLVCDCSIYFSSAITWLDRTNTLTITEYKDVAMQNG